MRPVAKSFSTKTEAARFVRLLESEIDRGVFVDRTEAQRSTLGELIDRYLAEVTPKKKSARSNAQCLRQLKRHFGAVSPAAIERSGYHNPITTSSQCLVAGRIGNKKNGARPHPKTFSFEAISTRILLDCCRSGSTEFHLSFPGKTGRMPKI